MYPSGLEHFPVELSIGTALSTPRLPVLKALGFEPHRPYIVPRLPGSFLEFHDSYVIATALDPS
jgi:hypothetical protein